MGRLWVILGGAFSANYLFPMGKPARLTASYQIVSPKRLTYNHSSSHRLRSLEAHSAVSRTDRPVLFYPLYILRWWI